MHILERYRISVEVKGVVAAGDQGNEATGTGQQLIGTGANGCEAELRQEPQW